MRKLLIPLTLFFCLAAAAQVRTYGDMETKTFVIGLSNYYFGDAGSLSFLSGGETVTVTLSGGRILADGEVLLEQAPAGNSLVGAHDFTGDGVPEILAAVRGRDFVKALIFKRTGGKWLQIGTVGARGDVQEIRIFRQALTIRDKASDVLYTWTCHGGRFDFKSSSGGPDPSRDL